MVVDRLVDQLPGAIADGLPVDLDRWVGPDHLQIEYVPAGPDRLDHVAQDVHDVLRVYSSERQEKTTRSNEFGFFDSRYWKNPVNLAPLAEGARATGTEGIG